MKFTASKEIEFDAGHRVPYHDSQCRYLHGHRYRVRATVEAHDTVQPDPDNPRSGMVLDFGEIKKALVTQVHDPFDHKLILWDQDPLVSNEFWDCLNGSAIARDGLVLISSIPTAEELARIFFDRVNAYLKPRVPSAVLLEKIEVWETPTSLATYRGER